MEVQAADHDWKCEKIAPSLTGGFNIGENVGDSLLSVGEDGRGYYSMTLHDETFEPSSSYHHCASLMSYIFADIRRDVVEMAEEEYISKLLPFMPYELLIETYSGPDHDTRTLHNMMTIFSLFLVSGVVKFIAILGCPVLLYLNTEERAMSVLNLGLANLALQIDLCEWLSGEVLANMSSMKAVRMTVSEYDSEIQTVIDVLMKCRLKRERRMDPIAVTMRKAPQLMPSRCPGLLLKVLAIVIQRSR